MSDKALCRSYFLSPLGTRLYLLLYCTSSIAPVTRKALCECTWITRMTRQMNERLQAPGRFPCLMSRSNLGGHYFTESPPALLSPLP